jgi:hypothetical protein
MIGRLTITATVVDHWLVGLLVVYEGRPPARARPLACMDAITRTGQPRSAVAAPDHGERSDHKDGHDRQRADRVSDSSGPP